MTYAIMEIIPPDKWNHVKGLLINSVDCASRGLFPSELIQHPLWWTSPTWFKQSPAIWPTQSPLAPNESFEEISLHVYIVTPQVLPIILFNRHYNFNQLKQVTAWTCCFMETVENEAVRIDSPLSSQL